MKILFIGSQGSNNPTQAAFPFVYAKGAIEAGHEPTIFLAGESTYLLKQEVANLTQAVGLPKQSDLWADIVKARVPVFV